jgi:hypothetical protein
MRERAANCQVSETLEEAWGWGFCNLCHLNKTISSFSIDLIGPQFVIYHWLTGPLNFSPKCGFEAWAFILFCTRISNVVTQMEMTSPAQLIPKKKCFLLKNKCFKVL